MSKRKRLKGSNKKNRTGKIQSVPGMVNADYVSVYGPFKNFSKEQISEVVNKLGDHNKLEFSKVLNELQEHIRPFDLLSMISYFSYYFLTTPPGINTEWERRDFVKQHDIEILQALKLQETLEDNKEWRPLLPENAEAINNLLKRLSSSYSLQRFQYKDNQQEQKQLGIIERIRENTMVIRNWGYAKQIIRIVEDIYRPIDDAIERETGLSIIKLLHMCVSINNIIEDRMNEHLKKTRSILQTKSVADLVDAYLNNYPFVKSSREDLLKLREEFR